MSLTVCTYPIVGAIRKADDMLGPDRTWRALNPQQKRFLSAYYTPAALADLARIPELEAIASKSAAEVNGWLAARKFDITLDPFPGDGFGTACMLDVLVAWLATGDTRRVTLVSRQTVPGVFLTQGVTFWRSPIGVTARIETKSGDTVHLCRWDNPDGLEGLDLADFMSSFRHIPEDAYHGVHFPMVDLNQKPDISWLVGADTTDEAGDPWYIAQALQQTKFKMNEFGARVKSAAAVGVYRSTAVPTRPKPPLVINGPFLLEIARPGLSAPFLVAHITPEDMRDPGDLANM